MKRDVQSALDEAANRINREDFVRAILTGKRRSKTPKYKRVDIRPVQIKEEVMLQAVAHDGKKDFTSNHPMNSTEIAELLDSGFANLIIDSTSESFQIQITKKDEAITGVSKTSLKRELSHDRDKRRLLDEAHPIFRALEMSDASGRIKPTKRDKYIQIDQLLRILEPTLERFQEGSTLQVVDLASGSAALTLALHVYLNEKYVVSTTGVEQNPDLVARANEKVKLAKLNNIDFVESSIQESRIERADIVFALHACDLATDAAIDFVLKVKARVALIVPCCHQTRSKAVRNEVDRLPFFGQDGIVDERLLDLATDAFRAERLRESGYQVEVVEFVGDEHTARNLLIRAVRKDTTAVI